ncbi:pyridoxamine 5'-phosphate oxidase family protein [Tessaracoccus antarcticus]|uniref:Pyridoxamine 5'-phosphate oxidase family protein n=1 Tax=Tessaracoccus antarcticus TaxID=2479848 RepID=A0A3M0G1U9_9ACTN|nr:pyridoxamine 5'-phosphate oxidase family protein [Tessaracoccus antarcticus]RMB58904.1 pyridoxamine 5'-phosphate oxidase family protein [Tessaracoccus antarcticus]
MTTNPAGDGYFSSLDAPECRKLLASQVVGRVAWESAEGINVFPVNYRIVNERVVFHTSESGPLSALLIPTKVGFQVDEFDAESAVGWTLLARGTTASAEGLESVSWVPDGRHVGVAINVEWLGGRVVSGTPS